MRASWCGAVLWSGVLLQPAGGQQVTPQPIPVLAWRVKELTYDPWSPSPYPNITQFVWLSESNAKTPAAVKALTDQQPVGRRVIFDWDFYRAIYKHPADQLKTAAGESFTGPWWDHGRAATVAAYDQFFAAYKAAGGQLDYFILDTEHSPGSDVNNAARWAAVAADPRCAALLAAMKLKSAADIVNDKPMSHVWWRYSDHLAAQAYGQLLDVVRRHFPAVRCCDYGVHYFEPQTLVAWGRAREVGDIPGARGAHAGTHQSPSVYGVITYLAGVVEEGRPYGFGPYRSAMFATNLLREALLARPDVPLMPWVAWRGYVSDFEAQPPEKRPPYTAIGNTDYFQEVVFHTALCSPDALLCWSAFRWRPDQQAADYCRDQDLRLLDQLVGQVNQLVGYSDRRTLVTAKTPAHQPWILTGCRANGRSVWRLTPDPAFTGGDRNLVKAGDNPLTFQFGGQVLRLPGGQIADLPPVLSQAGWWITGPADLQPVVLTR
ncbi:MAG: hypothetical protein IT204_24115 [Fimbriimonadaceae bacterium]|nr:hypothetical protein [Fimbriimonadaceae bacterium]